MGPPTGGGPPEPPADALAPLAAGGREGPERPEGQELDPPPAGDGGSPPTAGMVPGLPGGTGAGEEPGAASGGDATGGDAGATPRAGDAGPEIGRRLRELAEGLRWAAPPRRKGIRWDPEGGASSE